MGLRGWHTSGQFGDIVMSVPFGQLVEPRIHGVILLNTGGVDEAVHILVPRLQSLLPSLDGHIVAYLLCQRLKRLVLRIFHAIFGHARHQILTHVVVGSQENFRSHRLQCLLGYALQRFHLVLLAIVLHQRDFVGRSKDTLH